MIPEKHFRACVKKVYHGTASRLHDLIIEHSNHAVLGAHVHIAASVLFLETRSLGEDAVSTKPCLTPASMG
mgnify:CR=1 FL=1